MPNYLSPQAKTNLDSTVQRTDEFIGVSDAIESLLTSGSLGIYQAGVLHGTQSQPVFTLPIQPATPISLLNLKRTHPHIYHTLIKPTKQLDW